MMTVSCLDSIEVFVEQVVTGGNDILFSNFPLSDDGGAGGSGDIYSQ